MARSGAAGSAGIINPLTGIRGFAAIWVVLYHLRPTIMAAYPDQVALHNLVGAGYLGVDLFSFLSGFIISYKYSEKLAVWDLRATGRYLWLRFVRTYPLHLFVLFLFLLLFVNDRGIESLAVLPWDYSFIRQLFLLNGLGLESHWAWNVPSWPLSSEGFCYLCFPLLIPLINRVRAGIPALMLAALSIMLTAVLLAQVGRPTFDAFLDWGLLRIGGEFLAGCFLYRAYVSGVGNAGLAGVAGLGAILFVVVKVAYFPGLPVAPVVAAFAVLVFTLAHNRQPLAMLFGNGLSVYLGRISYSIYMVHWFYLGNMAVFGLDRPPLAVRSWVVLGAVLVTAMATYHLVERTTGKYLRNRVLAGGPSVRFRRSPSA